ncbi:MAG: class I SAM-dependent methyltransferase, partial [Actinomycetota bacterium]|nr:class I SAM-dependent methyltransferase [Actinomycetota bacterium]
NREAMVSTYKADSYGEAFADVYDDWYAEVSDVAACATAVAELAQNGRVLELGVGTGRLAVPLAELGLDVVGVDASPAMLQRLSANDPGGLVTAHRMDMGAVLPPGPFDVVFVAYNTFFNLTSAAKQVGCLSLVRDRLAPTGHFVVEAFVPVLDGPDRGVQSRSIADGVVLNVTVRDPLTQIVRGQQVELGNDRVRLRPWQIHYLTPTQLDEMAASVGLRRVARWSDWRGTAFSDTSTRHVSVYASR